LYNHNAHAQEILLHATNITWRAIGGSIDLYFYSGPDAKSVVATHQKAATGLPAMQQYFTFGYHQCRWGYRNWTQVQEVVDNFAKFGIPLENIWTDIDYMNQYRDFDNDAIRFGYDEGKVFTDKLTANGQHYIPIVDSAIYIPNPDNASDAYPTFNRGNDSNAFMLNPDGSLYIGDVWPGYTSFPDWLPGSGAGEWWINEMKIWHSKVNWSGIWLDMSEVSSFCVGSCGSGNLSLNPVHPPFQLPGEVGNMIFDYPEGFNLTNATEASSAAAASASQSSANAAATPTSSGTVEYLRTTPTPNVRNINHPPYVIDNVQGDLAVHAVSPNATHHNGVQEYDVHNLFGHQIINATYHALLQVFPGKRPFIIGRSTFTGSGKYAGHWGGDNYSQFRYMFFSIPQALSNAIFGIPMFGVDTCGFNGNSDEELCNRWMQLSAFFPFYRNHNTFSAGSQEPYVWSSVIDATKKAMAIRFQLLPYIYTLFYQAHTTGSTVMRALSWEFPNDPTLFNADRQFFLGPAILVTPVLEQGQTTVDGVFPGAGKGEVYYDWYSQTAVDVTSNANTTIDAPLGHIPVYIRGGHILPTQQPAMTTRDARKTPWSILVALDSEGNANGELYLDDGESVAPSAILNVDVSKPCIYIIMTNVLS
jgi:alpha-glucosidase